MSKNEELNQEAGIQQEQVKPEISAEAPENYESVAENKVAEVDRTSQEVISATEQRLERAKTYYELPTEKAEEILTSGGFKKQLASIADRIRSLADSTKEKIMNLIGKKKTTEQIPAEETSTETIAKPENEITAELAPEETNLREKSEPSEKINGKQETSEIKELREYLQQKIFSKVGISQEQEQIALSEAPEEKRETIERSFKNMRDSVEAFYELETIDGRFDYASFTKEKDKRQAEIVYPYLENRLKEKGLGDIDLKMFGVNQEKVDEEEIAAKLGKALFSKKSLLKREVEEKINASLETDGRYKDIIMPSAEEIQNENIADEYHKKYDEIVRTEVDETTSKNGRDEILLPNQIKKEILNLKESVPEPNTEDFKVFNERENVLAEIQAETKNVDESAFLSINITPKKLEKVLETGDFKGLFSLDKEELETRASELSMGGAAAYLRQREATERALGTYREDKAVIYATLASRNGSDEKYGGAPVYGGIFIKLNPEVKKRALFTEGDSLTQIGNTSSVLKKLEKNGVNINNYEEFAQARQISQENATLAKSLINVERKRNEKLGYSSAQDFTYLEAHVMGGLNIDDFESINIPREIFESKVVLDYAGDHRALIDKLQNDPKWKDKINMVG